MLSKKTKYGIKALVHLARQEERTPKDIPMTTVMRLLEGPIAMVPCVSLNFYEKCEDCPDEKVCAVNKLMLKVRDNTLEIFRNTTLADLSN